MKPLYEIAARHAALQALDDPDMPEQAILDTIEGLVGEVEEKAISVAAYIRNIGAESAAIDAAIKAMQARKQALDKREDQVREYLRSNMERCGITKISCPWFAITVKKNPASMVIDDAELIPEKYKAKVEITEIDKAAMKADLKSDIAVAGARLVQRNRIEIK